MLGLNHTLSGGILALALPAPVAVPAAFISHFVLDAMPHFGDHPKFKSSTPQLRALIATDGIISVSAMLLMMAVRPDKWFLIGACCFFAVLPDLFWIFQKQLKTPSWILHFSSWIQWGERPYGWAYDGIYSILGVFIFMLLAK